jgi:hypothetical protein
MNCEYGNATLDDYFDHALSASEQTLFLAHCRLCAECRGDVDAHTRYMLTLKAFKLSSPAAAPVKARSTSPASNMEGVAVNSSAQVRSGARWLLRSAAAVASFTLGLSWYYTRDAAPSVADASEDIWSKVNIVIQVPATLDNAKLTVSLPQGIYIQGHEGMQTLAWNADFAEGTNALELPIRIDSASFDRSMPQYLDATLEYQGASKSFEFLVGLDDAVASTL